MATSPTAGTPTPSAASPTSSTFTQRPSLCMKPLPGGSTPMPTSAASPVGIGSLTSKEWVVPPRPKPGRKPATDTPPTKRKAQNRAAQRAFRERRAARVGELEEQLKQVEEENDQQLDSLKATVVRLEQDVEYYRTQLNSWMERYQQLEKEVSESRLPTSNQNSIHQYDVTRHQENDDEQHVGCGSCSVDTRCQCLDDAVHAMTDGTSNYTDQSHERDKTQTSNSHREKRIKTEAADDMEIDFTAMFSRPRTAAISRTNNTISRTSTVPDPCGFCQDGTPCICAEMAAEQESTTAVIPNTSGTTQRQLAQFTPPPSEGDVAMANTGSDVATAATKPPASCGSGSAPGTCAQCRADPNSTLFCKSLAASRSQSAGTPVGCCGGKGADGSCCQTAAVPLPPRNTRSRTAAAGGGGVTVDGSGHDKPTLPSMQVSKSSVTLSCADAYTTLSRHPAYDKASGDIANWMPKLHANPSGSQGRPAMEIDAANVMAVLRDFDRRFGADR